MKKPADIFMEVLADARKTKRLTFRQLAQTTGIPEHTLKRWEDGGQRPRIQSAMRLAAALGYRLDLVPSPSRRSGASHVH